MDDVALHRELSKYCEPLFLLDEWMRSGHSEATENGTLTYLKLDGKVYGVTCRHVVASAGEAKGSGRMFAAVMHGRVVSFFRYIDTLAGGYAITFRFPALPNEEPDIAIHCFGVDMAEAQALKGKVPIDLDVWREPVWSQVKLGAAVGYGTEHKIRLEDKVAAPMHVVTASLSSAVHVDSKQIVLSDQLNSPHGVFFSGLSGGPIFVDDGDESLKFAGIVFEGAPGSSLAWKDRDLDQSFIDERDIVVYGVRITPGRFREWVASCKF